MAGASERAMQACPGMIGGPREQWEMDKAAAAALLADRTRRRRVLGGFALALLGMLALGLWGIDGWLTESLMRFAVYWGLCGLGCLFVMLFAVFDALASIREIRGEAGTVDGTKEQAHERGER